MQDPFSRTRMLLGQPALDTLHASRVIVFGIGGVGGYVVEVLVRSGVGAIDVVDNDRVCPTNINRQILATHTTVGELKVDIAERRILEINPHCHVRKHPVFYLPENAGQFDLSQYDYVVDCIDTVTAKLDIIRRCHALGIPLLSCMGAAYKMDATQFQVTDISKTHNDPLARVVRNKLRKEGIRHLKVVYSPEVPLESIGQTEQKAPASNAWVPATAGLIAGGEVVKDLVKLAGTYRLSTQEETTSCADDESAEN